MSLLSVIKTFTRRKGLPSPSYITSSTDATVLQLWAMADEVVEDVSNRKVLQAMLLEAVFNTVAQEDQGSLSSLAPTGFLAIKDKTLQNRTLKLAFTGPLSAEQWQEQKAMSNLSGTNLYRIRGNRLLVTPTPAAGNVCAFEYWTSYGVVASNGTTTKPAFTADDDTTLFPEVILEAGLAWKWKSDKGLDYAEEFRRYEELLGTFAASDGTKRDVTMDCPGAGFLGQPVIIVPGGSILQ